MRCKEKPHPLMHALTRITIAWRPKVKLCYQILQNNHKVNETVKLIRKDKIASEYFGECLFFCTYNCQVYQKL